MGGDSAHKCLSVHRLPVFFIFCNLQYETVYDITKAAKGR